MRRWTSCGPASQLCLAMGFASNRGTRPVGAGPRASIYVFTPRGTCTPIRNHKAGGGGGRTQDGSGVGAEGGRTPAPCQGGGWSDAARERGRSVSATPIFFAALRAAVRVDRPDRIGNAALGQRRLETL